MKTITHLIRITVVGLVLGIAIPAAAEDRPKPHVPSAPLTDNQLMHHIRSAIVEDSTLPYCAQMVRVRTENGKVTLEGHVLTEDQKDAIEAKAVKIAGPENVTDNITLRTQKVASQRL